MQTQVSARTFPDFISFGLGQSLLPALETLSIVKIRKEVMEMGGLGRYGEIPDLSELTGMCRRGFPTEAIFNQIFQRLWSVQDIHRRPL